MHPIVGCWRNKEDPTKESEKEQLMRLQEMSEVITRGSEEG